MKTVKLFSIGCFCLAVCFTACNNPNQENPDRKISAAPVLDTAPLQKIDVKDSTSLHTSDESNTAPSKEETDDKPHTLN